MAMEEETVAIMVMATEGVMEEVMAKGMVVEMIEKRLT
jgi:hypothetical protein